MPSWKRVIVSGSSAHLNQITGSGGVSLPDGVRLNFGDANDLKIYHSGAHSIIQDTGTGNLELKGSIIKIRGSGTGESMAHFTENAGVELYYDSSKKLDVVTGGVDVTGTIQASGNISGSSTSTGSFGELIVADDSRIVGDISFGASSTTKIGAGSDTNLSFYMAGNERFKMYNNGGSIYWATTATGPHMLSTTSTDTVAVYRTHGLDNDGIGGADGKVSLITDSESRVLVQDIVTEFPVANYKISGSSSSTGSFGSVVVADHVLGSLKIKAASNAIQIYDSGNGNNYLNIHNNDIQTPTGVELNFQTNGANTALKLETDQDARFYGKVGIGKSPVSTLDITGTIHASGNISGSSVSSSGDILADGDVIAYNSSDERLKDNIEVIQGSLDKIDGIRGVEFDWNEKSPGWAQERGHDVGVIAQEVQKVIPEIVVERKSGYLGVDYKRIIPLLIESIKELKQEIEILKKKG